MNSFQLVEDLLAEIDAHVDQEGEEVEIRTRGGSWIDLRPRLLEIREAIVKESK